MIIQAQPSLVCFLRYMFSRIKPILRSCMTLGYGFSLGALGTQWLWYWIIFDSKNLARVTPDGINLRNQPLKRHNCVYLLRDLTLFMYLILFYSFDVKCFCAQRTLLLLLLSFVVVVVVFCRLLLLLLLLLFVSVVVVVVVFFFAWVFVYITRLFPKGINNSATDSQVSQYGE